MIRYALGMELALLDPTAGAAAGWTRESLLAGVGKQVALDEYELRLILRFDVEVDCPHDVTEGEMVFVVGPGIGGPIAEERARPILAEADAIGRSGELPDALAPLLIGPALGAKRTLIFPPYGFAQMSNGDETYPLHGVAYVPAAEVKNRLRDAGDIEEIAHLARLIDFCMRTRVVISVAT